MSSRGFLVRNGVRVWRGLECARWCFLAKGSCSILAPIGLGGRAGRDSRSAAAECGQVLLVEFLEHFLVYGVVLLAVRIDLRYDAVEVGIGPERTLAHQLLATRRTLFVAGAQRRYDTVVAEAVQALLGRHRVAQNVEADRTHELVLEHFGRDGYLGLVVDDLVRHSIQLVDVQLPRLGKRGRIATATSAAAAAGAGARAAICGGVVRVAAA